MKHNNLTSLFLFALFTTVTVGINSARAATTPCNNASCIEVTMPDILAAQQHISKQQAAAIATEHNPGRVLAVKRKGNYFRVKILRNNGNVVIVLVNAVTGAVK